MPRKGQVARMSDPSANQLFETELRAFQPHFNLWLSNCLRTRRDEAIASDPALDMIFSVLVDFAGRPGKRIRPFLAHWGYLAAGGDDPFRATPVAAAAEMLHAFALAHDDLMDESGLRRGLPTVHKMGESMHRRNSWRGRPEQFGLSLAVLVGDLAIALSDSLMDSADVPEAHRMRLRRVWNAMREEVMLGQFLDVLASNRVIPASEDDIWRILSLKSGKYSIERPLHLGACAAGAPDALLETLTRFAIPVGRAFQIQDDILGMFATEQSVGKPVDSDIREGKSTLLISHAYQQGSAADRETLLKGWGRAEASEADVNAVRDVVLATGARDYAESRAADLAGEACAVLETSSIGSPAREVLAGLAHFVLNRRA